MKRPAKSRSKTERKIARKAASKAAGKRKAPTKKSASPATKVVTRTPRRAAKAVVPARKPVVVPVAVKPVALKSAAKAIVAKAMAAKAIPAAAPKHSAATAARPRSTNRRAPHVTRVATTASAPHRQVVRMARMSTFAYMNAPLIAEAFDVGDTVEVFCDHERNGERVRGWIKGIVVQVDNKLVAVQFRSNVFLTDGWMVPDRILWYSLTSDQIRPATFAKRGSHKVIPDY
jgi:hypothetical protein